MKIITVSQLVDTAAERWRERLCINGQWAKTKTSPEEIYNRLVNLPSNKSRQDVIDALGYDGWVKLTCGECGKDVDKAAVFGEDYGYGSEMFYVCLACIYKAIEELEGAQ